MNNFEKIVYDFLVYNSTQVDECDKIVGVRIVCNQDEKNTNIEVGLVFSFENEDMAAREFKKFSYNFNRISALENELFTVYNGEDMDCIFFIKYEKDGRTFLKKTEWVGIHQYDKECN